jgi:PAP2 superfamily
MTGLGNSCLQLDVRSQCATCLYRCCSQADMRPSTVSESCSTLRRGSPLGRTSFVDARCTSRIARVLFLLLTAVFGPGLVASADVVTEWNTVALNAIGAQRTPPPTASRVLAILHVAIYDAVNGIERSHDPYMVDGQVPRSASMDAAATAAAHDALVNLFPSYADQCDALQTAQLTKIAEGPQKRHGIAWGRSVADRILAFRATDNFDAIVPLYDFWRPVTAIRNGDTDGSPATIGDPSWSSYLVTPPFPDYVSGHSTFSAAASVILALFFGRDTVMFTTGSDFLPGLSRQFTSFSAAANEAALSRIYGGIHFRSATEDGLKAGLDIGEWTFSHVMRPKGNHSR